MEKSFLELNDYCIINLQHVLMVVIQEESIEFKMPPDGEKCFMFYKEGSPQAIISPEKSVPAKMWDTVVDLILVDTKGD